MFCDVVPYHKIHTIFSDALKLGTAIKLQANCTSRIAKSRAANTSYSGRPKVNRLPTVMYPATL